MLARHFDGYLHHISTGISAMLTKALARRRRDSVTIYLALAVYAEMLDDSLMSEGEDGSRPDGRRQSRADRKLRIKQAHGDWPDWLVAAAALVTTFIGAGFDASAVSAAGSSGVTVFGLVLGAIAVIRLWRRWAAEQRDREKREVKELREAAKKPENDQLTAFKEFVCKEGRRANRLAIVLFVLSIIVCVLVAVLVAVFVHLIPTIR
jgi:hypothetical protein